jgi:hypothetical protein
MLNFQNRWQWTNLYRKSIIFSHKILGNRWSINYKFHDFCGSEFWVISCSLFCILHDCLQREFTINSISHRLKIFKILKILRRFNFEIILHKYQSTVFVKITFLFFCQKVHFINYISFKINAKNIIFDISKFSARLLLKILMKLDQSW